MRRVGGNAYTSDSTHIQTHQYTVYAGTYRTRHKRAHHLSLPLPLLRIYLNNEEKHLSDSVMLTHGL